MKTFLKVLLVIIAVVVAIKLLPAALVFVGGLIAGFLLLAIFGLSLLALAACVGVTLLALFSPLWIPVAVIVGVIALIKRLNRPAVATTA